MPCGDKAAVGQESHAAYFTVLRRFEDVDWLHFCGVPKSDGIIKRTCYNLWLISNLLISLLLHPLRIKTHDLEYRIGMSLNILSLLSDLDP